MRESEADACVPFGGRPGRQPPVRGADGETFHGRLVVRARRRGVRAGGDSARLGHRRSVRSGGAGVFGQAALEGRGTLPQDGRARGQAQGARLPGFRRCHGARHGVRQRPGLRARRIRLPGLPGGRHALSDGGYQHDRGRLRHKGPLLALVSRRGHVPQGDVGRDGQPLHRGRFHPGGYGPHRGRHGARGGFRDAREPHRARRGRCGDRADPGRRGPDRRHGRAQGFRPGVGRGGFRGRARGAAGEALGDDAQSVPLYPCAHGRGRGLLGQVDAAHRLPHLRFRRGEGLHPER